MDSLNHRVLQALQDLAFVVFVTLLKLSAMHMEDYLFLLLCKSNVVRSCEAKPCQASYRVPKKFF